MLVLQAASASENATAVAAQRANIVPSTPQATYHAACALQHVCGAFQPGSVPGAHPLYTRRTRSRQVGRLRTSCSLHGVVLPVTRHLLQMDCQAERDIKWPAIKQAYGSVALVGWLRTRRLLIPNGVSGGSGTRYDGSRHRSLNCLGLVSTRSAAPSQQDRSCHTLYQSSCPCATARRCGDRHICGRRTGQYG